MAELKWGTRVRMWNVRNALPWAEIYQREGELKTREMMEERLKQQRGRQSVSYREEKKGQRTQELQDERGGEVTSRAAWEMRLPLRADMRVVLQHVAPGPSRFRMTPLWLCKSPITISKHGYGNDFWQVYEGTNALWQKRWTLDVWFWAPSVDGEHSWEIFAEKR